MDAVFIAGPLCSCNLTLIFLVFHLLLRGGSLDFRELDAGFSFRIRICFLQVLDIGFQDLDWFFRIWLYCNAGTKMYGRACR
jgi:hypothetical protein